MHSNVRSAPTLTTAGTVPLPPGKPGPWQAGPLASRTLASRQVRRSNSTASFVTNINWQSYSGEVMLGHLVQMAGLAVQNFVSAAVEMAVVVALIRGFMRSRADRLGSFWVDRVRGCFGSCCQLAAVGVDLWIGIATANLGTSVDGIARSHRTKETL